MNTRAASPLERRFVSHTPLIAGFRTQREFPKLRSAIRDLLQGYCPLIHGVLMKKVAFGLVLLAVTSMSFAVNGCWRNGKYVMCSIDAPQESSVQR
jgi:hypothetical protein